MKKQNRKNSNQISKTNVLGLLWRWLKGMWGSFTRLFKRSVNPSTGRRPVVRGTRPMPSRQKKAPVHISPLVGVPKFLRVESLTVGNLFSNVHWNASTQTSTQTSTPVTVASVKDKISWD